MTETSANSMPLLGDKFPEMRVKTTHGMKNLPGEYAGRWFVLFSHPGDFTPVCTTEFYSFADRADQFAALNADLIGDRVIVPPAQTVADARKRPREYDCYDWWFCHKPLEE